MAAPESRPCTSHELVVLFEPEEEEETEVVLDVGLMVQWFAGRVSRGHIGKWRVWWKWGFPRVFIALQLEEAS